MKTKKFSSFALMTILIFFFTQMASAQLANFYSSSGYSSFINTMMTNHIWKSSMDRYTQGYSGGSGVSRADSFPEVVPEYRRYPAVQFKPSGTRLVVDTYVDAVQGTAEEKAGIKELILQILKDYEATPAAKTYANDWALAYVSFVGINTHIYHGKTEKLMLPFEQNVGLRDVVAEQATDNRIFENVTDKEKQQLYELMILIGGLTYHYYEKACKENNAQEIENCKIAAAQNLKLVGIIVQ